MKIIPAIDLIAGQTVRLERGEYDKKLTYEISPVDAARKWQSMGAELLHVVDLDGAKQAHPVNLPIIHAITRAVGIPVEVGGGFRTTDDIWFALDYGVKRVVLGSKAFEDKNFIRECFKNFGDRIILSVDAKNLQPRISGWEKGVDVDLFDVLREFVSFGAKEIIYTDIQKDGTLTGPSLDHLERILKEIKVNVISAGGVKDVDHIRELKKLEGLGLSGVIIGRALYEGTINLKEAIDAGKEDSPVS